MIHYNSVAMRLIIDSEYTANEKLPTIESNAFTIFAEKLQTRLKSGKRKILIQLGLCLQNQEVYMT